MKPRPKISCLYHIHDWIIGQALNADVTWFPNINIEVHCVAVAEIIQQKEICTPLHRLLLQLLTHASFWFGSHHPFISSQLPPWVAVGFTGSTYLIHKWPTACRGRVSPFSSLFLASSIGSLMCKFQNRRWNLILYITEEGNDIDKMCFCLQYSFSLCRDREKCSWKRLSRLCSTVMSTCTPGVEISVALWLCRGRLGFSGHCLIQIWRSEARWLMATSPCNVPDSAQHHCITNTAKLLLLSFESFIICRFASKKHIY